MSYKNVKFVAKSGNRKTGPIPVSYTERSSCPDSCALKDGACYARFSFTGMVWGIVSKQATRLRKRAWKAFLDAVENLPLKQLWRMNVAGDFPHQLSNENRIAARRVNEVVAANRNKRGFTYTHYDVLSDTNDARHNASVVRKANAMGFTVNISTDTWSDADRAMEADMGPVVTMLESDDDRTQQYTDGGNRIMTCPGQWDKPLTCDECRWCSLADRKYIVGFKGHGAGHLQATEMMRKEKLKRADQKHVFTTLADSPLTVVRKTTR